MVLVPRATNRVGAAGPSQVVPVQQQVAPTSGFTDAGQALSGVADPLFQLQDDLDTAAAKEADSQFSDSIRQTLYDDQNGYLNTTGGNAVSGHGSTMEALQAERERVLEGLTGGARRKAQSSIDARLQSAQTRVDTHASNQRRGYLNQTADARVNSAVNDAIADPSQIQQSLSIAEQEIRDAGARNGTPPEVLDQQIVAARTRVHNGIISQLSADNPVEALRYLNENRDDMDAATVISLEQQLEPRAREWEGREIGRRAQQGDWLRYSYSQGTVRDDPLSDRLIDAMSFLPDMGITMEVFSGGQAAIGTPGEQRVGSTRHDNGNAADVFFYQNGRRLSWENPEDIPSLQEIVRRARSRGVTGFGAGPNYMRPGSMHIGFGTPAVWGADGKGENAPQWLVDAYNSAPSAPYGNPTADSSYPPPAESGQGGYGSGGAGGLAQLALIKDPIVRDAAMREYQLLAGIQAQAAQQQLDAASDQAFQLIEAGVSVDELPLEFRQSLGREEMSALRAYQKKVIAGQQPTTAPEVYVQLSEMAALSPQEFMSLNPIHWREHLDDGDFEKFVDLQRRMRTDATTVTPIDPPTLASLRSNAGVALENAGFADDPQRQAAFETEILRWASDFTDREGRKPTSLEVREQVNSMTTEVLVNPDERGVKTYTGLRFEVSVDGEQLGNGIASTTAWEMVEARIKIGGTVVDEEYKREFVNEFVRAFDRFPSPDEMIEGLTVGMSGGDSAAWRGSIESARLPGIQDGQQVNDNGQPIDVYDVTDRGMVIGSREFDRHQVMDAVTMFIRNHPDFPLSPNPTMDELREVLLANF